MEKHFYAERLKALHINATHVVSQGWHLTTLTAMAGEHWNDAARSSYSGLSRQEMIDIIESTIDTALGFA